MIVHGTNVNVALVRGGAASPYFFRNERGRYADELLAAVEEGPRREARLLGRLPEGEAEHGLGSITGARLEPRSSAAIRAGAIPPHRRTPIG